MHVCGGADEEPDCQRMMAASKYPERIVSHVGKASFAGYGNPQCKGAIKAGKCALCIDAISVEMVKTKIDTLLSV